jgi:hypothetical protein
MAALVHTLYTTQYTAAVVVVFLHKLAVYWTLYVLQHTRVQCICVACSAYA